MAVDADCTRFRARRRMAGDDAQEAGSDPVEAGRKIYATLPALPRHQPRHQRHRLRPAQLPEHDKERFCARDQRPACDAGLGAVRPEPEQMDLIWAYIGRSTAGSRRPPRSDGLRAVVPKDSKRPPMQSLGRGKADMLAVSFLRLGYATGSQRQLPQRRELSL